MTTAGLFIIGILQALLLLLAAPLYSGFVRVLRAKVQNRKGPPLVQNYRDIAKLMKRQEVVSEQAGWVFRVTPYVTMASMLLLAITIPILVVQSPLGTVGDLILVIYLFALPRFFFAVAGLDSGSTFAGIGSRREFNGLGIDRAGASPYSIRHGAACWLYESGSDQLQSSDR